MGLDKLRVMGLAHLYGRPLSWFYDYEDAYVSPLHEEAELHQAKSGRSRVIPLVDESLALLKSLREDGVPESGFLFPGSDGGPLSPGGLSYALSRAGAGLEGLRFRDLRHTHA